MKKCLDACPDWELVKPPQFAEKWKHFGSPKWKHVGKKCIYARSDVDLTDGFFMAVFERRVDVNETSVDHDPDRDFLEQIRRNFEPPTIESEGESDDQIVPKKEPTEKFIKQEKDALSSNPFKIKVEPVDSGYVLEEANIDKTENISEEPIVADEPVKKKLKKIKPTETLRAEVDEPVNNLCEVTDELTKKKKKKRVLEESEIANEILFTAEEIPIEKKKKKSKRIVDEEAMPVEILEQPIKTKKRKHQSEQQFDIDVNETATVLKKKKKKKGNLSTETV